MRIMDIAYVDTDAKHALLALIRNFSADINKVHVNLPYTEEVESYLTSVLEDCKFNQWPAMLRVLDIKKSFESLSYPNYLKEQLLFHVEDTLITENTGVWQLDISEGKCIASKVEIDKEDEKVLKLTLHQLSQLLSGYSSIDKILEHKNTPIPEEWKDKHLFPEVQTGIMVWF
jgi:predicted acetyltransferase